MDLIVIISLGTLALSITAFTWLSFRLNRLYQHLTSYRDHVGRVNKQVKKEIITEEFIAELRNHASLYLQNSLQKISQELEDSIGKSYQDMSLQIEKAAAGIINGELEQYRQTIAQAREAAVGVTNDTHDLLARIRTDVEQRAHEAVSEEKQKVMRRIDTQLADVITTYLLDAMEENVDLGAQSEFIFRKLEERKEEMKQDINDEF